MCIVRFRIRKPASCYMLQNESLLRQVSRMSLLDHTVSRYRREKELEEQQVLNKAASIQTRQSQKAESLRPEPIAGGSEPIVAVRIRLPNGVNCQRRFRADRPIQVFAISIHKRSTV